MKNTKLSRILILVLSIVVLAGAVIGFSASAEDTEYTNEIVSMNIAYGDTVQVLIALDAPVDNQEGITVKYIDPNGDEQTATYWKTMDVKGTDRPVWYTKGISAKDLGQDVVATVYVNDKAISTANVSVAHYIYTKLYKEGYINAKSETDLHKKDLYQNLLAYAASAETVLWNDKAENASNQRVLITDKMFVYAKDGTVDAGKTTDADVLTKDEQFTLNFTGTAPEGYEFSGMWVSTIDGNSVIENGVAAIPAAHGVYEPVFKSTTANGGKYYTSENDGTRYDFDTKLNLDVIGDNCADLSVYNAETNPTGILAGTLATSDGYTSFFTDKISTLDNSTGELVFNMLSSDWTGFSIAYKGDTQAKAGTKYVFEADFKYIDGAAYTGTGSSENVPIFMGLTANNESTSYLHANVHAKYTGEYNGLEIGNAVLAKGVSYSLRVVYGVGGDYEVYINDVLVATQPSYNFSKASDYSETTFTGFGIAIRQRHAGDNFSFSLDNVYLGKFDSYYEDKTVEGTRYDFSNSAEYGQDVLYSKTTANTVTDPEIAGVSNGVLALNTTTNSYLSLALANNGKTTSEATPAKYIFEMDFTWKGGVCSTVNRTVMWMGFLGEHDTVANSMMPSYFDLMYVDEDTLKIASKENKCTGYELQKNVTYNIRMEYTVGAGTTLYINNVSTAGADVYIYSTTADSSCFNAFGVYTRNRLSTAFEIDIDNVYMGVK